MKQAELFSQTSVFNILLLCVGSEATKEKKLGIFFSRNSHFYFLRLLKMKINNSKLKRLYVSQNLAKMQKCKFKKLQLKKKKMNNKKKHLINMNTVITGSNKHRNLKKRYKSLSCIQTNFAVCSLLKYQFFTV